MARVVLGFDVGDGIDGADAVTQEFLSLFEGVETTVQNCLDLDGGRRPLRVEKRLHAIEGLALEVHDFLLPVDDEAEGDGLDAAGGKLRPDFAPKDGGEFESDQAVQHAPGLLGVDQVHVDLARMLDGVEHRRLRDLMEGDAPGLGGIELQGFGQVPGDGLSFAVFIGCEPDRFRAFRKLLELRHYLLFVGRHDILGREIMCKVDAQVVLLQVAYMADAGLDGVLFLVQEVPDGFGLLGRLNDD